MANCAYMTDAFVNVVVDGDATAVMEQITELTDVSEIHQVVGEFDLIIEVTLAEPDVLQRLVTGHIQTVEGVTDTTTLVTPQLADQHTPATERTTTR